MPIEWLISYSTIGILSSSHPPKPFNQIQTPNSYKRLFSPYAGMIEGVDGDEATNSDS